MKVKIGILLTLLVFTGVYGWRLIYGAYSSYGKFQETNKEIEAIKQNVITTRDEIHVNEELIMAAYKVATVDSLYDFTNEFLAITSATFTKAVGKRFVNSTATTVASCNSLDDLHNSFNLDTLEIIVTVDNVSAFLKKLEDSNYFINKLVVYPTDNCVSVEVFVLGGVTE